MTYPWRQGGWVLMAVGAMALSAPAFASPASVDWLDKAADAWEMDSLEPAVLPTSGTEAAMWRTWAAAQGNAQAAFELAYAYATPDAYQLGTSENSADVLKWATLAAERGHAGGAYLAARYHATTQNPPDRKTATAYLIQAARAGLPAAQFALGIWASPAASGEAVGWLRRAASAGDAPAQVALGQMLASQQDASAELWLHRGAEQSYLPGAVALGDWFAARAQPRWAQAVKWYRFAAQQGDMVGKRRLAACFEHGRGLPVEPQRAAEFYLMTANEATDRAAIAVRLLLGQGLPVDRGRAEGLIQLLDSRLPPGPAFSVGVALVSLPDKPKEAVRWLAVALFGGEAKAEPLLRTYLSGLSKEKAAEAQAIMSQAFLAGIPREPQAKLGWVTRAAEFGLPDAQVTLANIYEREPHVAPLDLERAMMWYRRAAAQGQAGAIMRVQAWEAHQRSQSPVDMAALERDAGRDPAKLLRIARMYDALNTPGVPRNVSEAIKWYRRAAEAGERTEVLRLAFLLEAEPKTPADQAEAMHWYQVLADSGNTWAMTTLGERYREGVGAARNVERAVTWFEKAAWAGDIRAFRLLIALYEGANGSPPDPDRALLWLKAGAESLDAYSFRRLGEFSEAGRFVAPSLPEAYKWYRLSVWRRSSQAPAKLERLQRRMSAAELEEGKRRLAMWVIAHSNHPDLKSLEDEAHLVLNMKRSSADETVEDQVERLQLLTRMGSSWAMGKLASLYREGRLLPRNDELADRWLLSAVEAGDISSMHTMSQHYLEHDNATSQPRDRVTAYMWWLAATASAPRPVAWPTISQLSPEQVATARRQADAWLRTHPRLPKSNRVASD